MNKLGDFPVSILEPIAKPSLPSVSGQKQPKTRWPIPGCFTPNSRHRNGFMTENDDGTMLEAERRRSHTNPEKRGVSNLNIGETRIFLQKLFFHIFILAPQDFTSRKWKVGSDF
jgi:hypothetical protein